MRGYHEEDIRKQYELEMLAKGQELMVEYEDKKRELEYDSQELLKNIQGDDAPLSPLFRDYLKRLSERTP